jgi:membrane protease subunit (stomatin/prohibitin family)
VFGKKKPAQLIKCDQTDYLIHQYSSEKIGKIAANSKLVVNESEIAVFVYAHAGENLFDFVEGPVSSQIDAATNPTLFSKLFNIFGRREEIEAEVYFINLSGIIQLKFGIPYFDIFDPRFQDFYVPMAVRGSFVVSISDARSFLKLNRLQHFDLERLKQQLKDVAARKVKSIVSNVPQQYNMPVIQLEKRVDEVSEACHEELKAEFKEFGLILKRFDISAISPDKESEGYRELRHLTAGQSSKIIVAETQAKVNDISTQQQIGAEHQRSSLEIQREETQRAQKLSTETQYLAAHRANLAAEVDINAAVYGQGDIQKSDPLNSLAQVVSAATISNINNQMTSNTKNMAENISSLQNPPPIPQDNKEIEYFVALNGQQIGPLSVRNVVEMLQSNKLSANDLVWKEGMKNWQKIEDADDIRTLIESSSTSTPPPLPDGP